MPFYGVEKMTAWLIRQGFEVNPKRVRRLMRLMGLEAIYPKPHLSLSLTEHKKYPYMLRDVAVERPDHVWITDITYVKMSQGFLYLVAILDWYSRYVLAWRLSNTLDTQFCIDALEGALAMGIGLEIHLHHTFISVIIITKHIIIDALVKSQKLRKSLL